MKLQHLLIVVFCSVSLSFMAQDVAYQVRVTNYTTNKKEAGATVKVLDGSTVAHTGVTSSSGEFAFDLKAGKTYKVEVSKAGKVTRFIMVNVSNVNDELIQGTGSVIGSCQISLFDEVPNVDYSYVTQNPITTFTYDGKNPELVFDANEAKKMGAQIDKILKNGADAEKQKEADYNAAVKNGDALAAQKKYAEAIKEYEKAAGLKSKETYPVTKITELDAIVKAEANAKNATAQLDQDYQNLITAGNTLRDQGKHAEAILKYQEALTKKQEQYPKDEIIKAQKAITDAKSAADNKAKYDAAMATAATFYNQKSWQAAKDKYKEALKAIPNDATATAKIADIDGKLNAQKTEQEVKANYQKLVDAGDALFTEKKYAEAKTQYEAALKIMSGAQYVTGRIAECDAKLAEAAAAKAKETQITKLLEEGNTAFVAKQWAGSKLKYQEVVKLDAANAIAAGRITEIDAKIAEEKANADKIAAAKKLLVEGDALAKTAKNKEALAKYNEAQATYNDPAVQPKIDAVNAAIAAAADKEQKKVLFDKAIADGDAALASSNYEAAKAKYTEAQTLDIASTIPKAKLAEVDKKMTADQASAKKAKFDKAIADGDAALAANNIEGAKAKYTEAQTIDAASPLPKQKIADIDKKIAADQASAKKAQFDKAIADGDAALAANNIEGAKAKYTEAQTLDAASPLPKQKIADIDKKIAADQASAKKVQFDKAIADGDAALAANNIEGAKAKYTEAQTIDAASPLPKQKIADIDKKIAADQASAKKAQFDKAIADGDAALATNNFEGAKAKYTDAQAIDVASTLPKQKIADVDKKIAANQAATEKAAKYAEAIQKGDAAMTAKDYVLAKTSYTAAIAIDNSKEEAKTKLAQSEKFLLDNAALEQQKVKYDAAVKAGGELQSAGKLTEAKAKFVEANKIDGTQSLPVDKIKEIDLVLAADAKKLEISKLMTEGNSALTAKNYTDAKSKYQQVIALDGNNTEAKTKLAEAIKAENDAIGDTERKAKFQALKAEGIALMGQNKYQEAKTKLNEAKSIQADVDVDKKIAECDAKIAELAKGAESDKQYNDLMNQARALESASKLDEAIAKYTEAIAVKNVQEPKDRITAINALKQNQGQAAKLDEEFNKLVKDGDAAFASTEYVAAIAKYSEALSKKSDPTVQSKKAEAERLNAAKGTTEAEEQYQKVLTAGQKAIDEKDYVRAKDMYNRAIGVRSNDPFPKQKLADIEALMKAEADAKNKEAAYVAKMAEAEGSARAGKLENAITLFEQAKTIKPTESTPDTRIAELRAQLTNVLNPQLELDKKYADAMNAGNALATGKDYNGAISKYQEALAVKPKDSPATAKIAEMRQILDNAASANKNKAEIDALVLAADKLFAAENWSDAKTAYDKVLVKDPANSYSKTQGDICQQKIDAITAGEREKEYRKLITVADKNFDEVDYKKAKDYYKRAVNVRPSDPYPRKRLEDIENLMNPQVVVKTNPPLLSQNDPKPLKSLGELNTSPDEEDGKRLEESALNRKHRNPRKMKSYIDSAQVKNDGLTNNQLELTTKTNQTFAEINSKSDKKADSSEVIRQDNLKVINGVDDKHQTNAIESNTYETADREYINGQLTLITDESTKANTVLDGGAGENAVIFANSQTSIVEKSVGIETEDHNKDLHSDQQFSDFKVTQDKKVADDFEERKVNETIVQSAYDKTVQLGEQSAGKKTVETIEVKEKLQEVNDRTETQALEDMKQSPINAEELKEIDKKQVAQVNEDTEDHTLNMLKYKEILVQEEQVVIDLTESSGQQRIDNTNILDKTRVDKEELDRSGYNQLYEKSLSNQTTLTAEVVKQEEGKELPSLVPKSNGDIYQTINTKQKESADEAGSAQDTKHLNNQGVLTQSTIVNDASGSKSIEKQSNNAEIVKKTQDGLGAADTKQLEIQNAKTLSSKTTLTAIETKEVVVGDKPANDLGKLYPEGVSQEKFDQKGSDGLISAIVTRRVVVKAGHGDEYIKTQTITLTTYSKNGQATTEDTWLKETQDARLVKNY